jgi:hypothetical protein
MSDTPGYEPTALAARIAGLIPAADDGLMWERRYAALLDHAADLDDVAFARMASEGAAAITDLNAFAADFFGGFAADDPHPIDSEQIRQSGLRLASIPRDLRSAFLKALAAKLRGDATSTRPGRE